MRTNRGIDDGIGRQERINRALWDAIGALGSEKRAAATTITDGDLIVSGGAALIVDGGDFLLLDTDKSTVFRLGPQQYGDRGVSIFREDGTIAIGVRKVFPASAAQTLELRDRQGRVIVSEEALGSGLARPLLHIPMQPVLATPAALPTGPYGVEVPCAETTWTTTHQAWYARHNQYGRFVVQVAASDTTTAGEVRVIDAATGDPLSDLFQPPWLGVRAAGATAHVAMESPRLALPGAPDARIAVAVQVRRTAGAGTLHIAVPESHGS